MSSSTIPAPILAVLGCYFRDPPKMLSVERTPENNGVRIQWSEPLPQGLSADEGFTFTNGDNSIPDDGWGIDPDGRMSVGSTGFLQPNGVSLNVRAGVVKLNEKWNDPQTIAVPDLVV